MAKRTRRTKTQMEEARQEAQDEGVQIEIIVPNVRGEHNTKYYLGETPTVTRELAAFLISREQAK